jgi:conjugal transfer pilus assembly protein TraK
MTQKQLVTICLYLSFAANTVQAIELPVVPVSAMKQSAEETVPVITSPTPNTPKRFVPEITPDMGTGAMSEYQSPALKITNEKSEIVITQGVTEISPVAVGQVNRIVTPFENPELNTTSDAITRIDSSVIYIAPKNEAPVGLYITEKGDESTAISITLVPKRIPPREIRLRLSGQSNSAAALPSIKARRWEESYPYEETIRNVLHAAAMETIPQGYSIGKSEEADKGLCQNKNSQMRDGIIYDFTRGQTLNGANFNVVIGVVRNNSRTPVELKEAWCANSDNVAAVAYWPNVVLEPNTQTEVYIVRRRVVSAVRKVSRPSLLE